MISIAVTGHRPNKLPCGYDMDHPWALAVITRMKNYILAHAERHNGVRIISGMALGIDQMWAIAGVKAQREDNRVSIELAIPCANQSKKWPPVSQRLWQQIVDSVSIYDNVNKITYVSNKEYTSSCMQLRNEYMVDNCDLVLAFWDGTPGGTANCKRYADKVGKPVQQVIPKSIS